MITEKLTRRLSGGVVGLAVATAVVLPATPAQAAGVTTVSVSNFTLFVTAASGTTNDIRVERSINGQILEVSDGAGVAAGSGCFVAGFELIQCTAPFSEVRVLAGDGNDRVFLNTSTFSRVLGGTGQDTLTSVHFNSQARLSGNEGNDIIRGAQFDSLFGQDGHDTLTGGAFLSGGTGDDKLTSFDGRQTLDGGAGSDRLNAGDGLSDRCVNGESVTGCEIIG